MIAQLSPSRRVSRIRSGLGEFYRELFVFEELAPSPNYSGPPEHGWKREFAEWDGPTPTQEGFSDADWLDVKSRFFEGYGDTFTSRGLFTYRRVYDNTSGKWISREVGPTGGAATETPPAVPDKPGPPVASPTGMPWISLPANTPIVIRAGYVYYVIAYVKTSHPKSEITESILPIGEFLTYDETSPVNDYRTVTFMARATKNAPDAPWSAPSWVLWDKTHVISAWYSPPPGKGKLPPPQDVDYSTEIIFGVLGAASLGTAWWWWRERRRESH